MTNPNQPFEYQDIEPTAMRSRGAKVGRIAMMDNKTLEMIENFQRKHNL